MKKKRVGIFGGSFDPVHYGHLHLALSIKEAAGLDEVILVPALLSPFKTDHPPQASAQQRVEMLRLAFQSLPGFSICEDELARKAPSYTVDTLEIFARDTSLELYLLMAKDVFTHFASWKDAGRIASLSQLLVASFGHDSCKDSSFGARFISIPCLEISSTLVRTRLRKGLYCGHLVPEAVLNYIHTHRLYEK